MQPSGGAKRLRQGRRFWLPKWIWKKDPKLILGTAEPRSWAAALSLQFLLACFDLQISTHLRYTTLVNSHLFFQPAALRTAVLAQVVVGECAGEVACRQGRDAKRSLLLSFRAEEAVPTFQKEKRNQTGLVPPSLRLFCSAILGINFSRQRRGCACGSAVLGS